MGDETVESWRSTVKGDREQLLESLITSELELLATQAESLDSFAVPRFGNLLLA